MKKQIRILFITRKFPPVTGGMEKYSYDLYKSLKRKTDIDLIANDKGNKYLIPFLIRTFFRIVFSKKNYKYIHLGDGLMSILIPLLRIRFPSAKISITVHGLDITYGKHGYQKFIPKLIGMADKVVCVSKNTVHECVKRGIDKKKCIFIPNGINFDEIKDSKKKLHKFKDKIILFSIGRFVKRKGYAWFVSKVMPKLPEKYIYLIAGDGREKDNIRNAIEKSKLSKRVFMLGRISDEDKVMYFKHSDVFIMPNIKVKGDVEGFGITIIEAGAYGLPVVASKVDGIPSAVLEKETGYLVSERDSDGFVKAIRNCHLKRDRIIKIVKENFDWENIAKRYLGEVFI